MSDNSLNQYRGLLLDIDGTITRTDRTIAAVTQQAIQNLPSQYTVGVCTGRCLPEVTELIGSWWPQPSWHVVAGGAQMVQLKDNAWTVLWEKPIDATLAAELVQTVTQMGAEVGFGHHSEYAATGELKERKAAQLSSIPLIDLPQVTNWSIPLIAVINLSDEASAYIDSLHANNQVIAKRMISFRSGLPYYDITAPGVTKSLGAQEWSEQVDIPLEQIIAVGDSENDLEVMQAVGHGVALGNAIPELKAVADRVIGHTDADGLAEFLAHF